MIPDYQFQVLTSHGCTATTIKAYEQYYALAVATNKDATWEYKWLAFCVQDNGLSIAMVAINILVEKETKC